MKNIFIVLLLAFSFVLHAQSKTIVISAVTDLKGETYVVPKGSVMKFIGQGLIKNGSIVFDETTLVNPCFEAMSSYKGTITNSKLESKRFGCNNDTALLYFLLNQNRSGITISLEKRRYMIDTPPGDVKYLSALSEFNNLSDITILGNGAEICDQTVPDRVNGKYRIFLKFISCSNVTITDITYTWMYEAVIAPKVIRGMVFIQTFDECRNFNIDIAVNNAASAFESGAWNYTSGHAGRGICDSKIKILAYKVGYPIAIERGDRLDIKNYFELVHRGCYLAGVTNTRVLCKGKDAYGTSCNLLLTDTMDADGWYMSDNIRAISIDTGSKKNRKNVDLVNIKK